MTQITRSTAPCECGHEPPVSHFVKQWYQCAIGTNTCGPPICMVCVSATDWIAAACKHLSSPCTTASHSRRLPKDWRNSMSDGETLNTSAASPYQGQVPTTMETLTAFQGISVECPKSVSVSVSVPWAHPLLFEGGSGEYRVVPSPAMVVLPPLRAPRATSHHRILRRLSGA